MTVIQAMSCLTQSPLFFPLLILRKRDHKSYYLSQFSLSSHHPTSPGQTSVPDRNWKYKKHTVSLWALPIVCRALSWALGTWGWMESKAFLEGCAHTRHKPSTFPSREEKENLWAIGLHTIHPIVCIHYTHYTPIHSFTKYMLKWTMCQELT